MQEPDWICLTVPEYAMCKFPAIKMAPEKGVVGQTTVSGSGWIMVKVRARGGKCFVRVRGSLTTSVESYGEGTFGEVFGNLSGMGECEGKMMNMLCYDSRSVGGYI